MPLTSAITDYDKNWPRLFDVEADRLRPVFENTNVAVHHVGSTTVVGLAAKPEIDTLVIVSDVDHLKHWQAKLLDLGYKRGRDLMEGHYFSSAMWGASEPISCMYAFPGTHRYLGCSKYATTCAPTMRIEKPTKN